MKQILIFTMLLFSVSLFGQESKKPKFQNMERCLDSDGDPIPNCFVISNNQGKFTKRNLAQTVEILYDQFSAHSESAVDSIWTSGDSLYITFFDAPTIGYRTNGLNGLYSLTNNNKVMSVYQTTLGINGWTIQKSGGTYGLTFNNSINSTVFNGGVEPVRTNNQMGFTGGGRVWRAGASGTSFAITDATTGGTPTRFSIVPGSLVNSLSLRSDGDVTFGNYLLSRPFDSSPSNFAGFDNSGIIRKYQLSDIASEMFSFTEGSLLFADTDGSITEDNSNLFYNNDANKVGINKTSDLNGVLDIYKTHHGAPSLAFSNLQITGIDSTDFIGGYYSDTIQRWGVGMGPGDEVNWTMYGEDEEFQLLSMHSDQVTVGRDVNAVMVPPSITVESLAEGIGFSVGAPDNIAAFDENGTIRKYQVNEISVSNDYDTDEQIRDGETWFGELIFWRTWIFDNGIDDLEDIPGLTDDIVSHVVRVDGMYKSTVDGSWSVLSTQLSLDGNQYQTTTSNEGDLYLTVYYTRVTAP